MRQTPAQIAQGVDPMFSAQDARFLRALRIHAGYPVPCPLICFREPRPDDPPDAQYRPARWLEPRRE